MIHQDGAIAGEMASPRAVALLGRPAAGLLKDGGGSGSSGSQQSADVAPMAPLTPLTEIRAAAHHPAPPESHLQSVFFDPDRFYPLFMSSFPFYSAPGIHRSYPTRDSYVCTFVH